MEELNTQQSISAAFDSVNLINNTILETVSDDNKSTVTRNVQHLENNFKLALNSVGLRLPETSHGQVRE